MSSYIFSSRPYVSAFVAALLAGLSVSILLTEIMLRRHVLPFDSHVGYKRLFLHGVAPTVAFGDSHVASGLVSSTEIDNLGQPSDNVQTASTKAELRLKRGGVRMVILQADPQMFSAYREKANQQNRLVYLLEENQSLLVMLLPQYRQYLMRYWLAAISDPVGVFRSPQQRPIELKKSSNLKPIEELQRQVAIRVQLHAPLPNFRSLPSASRYRDVIKRFAHQGLRVCLVAFPVSSQYRSAANTIPSFEMARSFFAETAHDLGAPYLDYYDAMPDSDFGDPDHLSTNAAAYFTRQVLRDCVSGKLQSR